MPRVKFISDAERRAYNVERQLRYRARHRNKVNSYRRKYATEHPEKIREYNQRHYYKDHEKTLQWHRDYRDRLKREVFDAYGSICTCCGENEFDFLSIDHVFGYKNRPDLYDHPRKGGMRFYLWLKSRGFPKEGFTLLCFNCNLGRAKSSDGRCPHTKVSVIHLVGACG